MAKSDFGLDDIHQKINRNNRLLTQKNKQKKTERQRMSRLNRNIQLQKIRLKKNKNELSQAILKERQLAQNIDSLTVDFELKKAAFIKRIKGVYEHQNFFSYGMFLDENWFVNDVDHYYFQLILKKDFDLVSVIKNDYHQLQIQKGKWAAEKEKVLLLKRDIHHKKRILNARKKKKVQLVKSLTQEIAVIEKRNKELEQASFRLTSMIRKGKGKGFFGSGIMKRPCRGWVSSRYGYRRHPIFKRRIKHNGIDLAAPRGRKIKAADSGVVIFSGQAKRYKGYGKVTVIDHGQRKKDGKRLSTVYAHQSRTLVKSGDFVYKGDLIGYVGSTGYATGPHLHFEVRLDGIPTNPQRFVKF